MQRYLEIKVAIFKLMGWGVLVYFLTVVCFYFVSIVPLRKQLVQFEQRTEALKREVGQLKGQYIKKWENQKEEVLGIIDSFQLKKGDKDVILSEVFRISKDSGIDIEKTEPLKDEVISDTMIKYSWKINCSADYPAIGTFFNRIESDPLTLSIEAPSIQSAEDLQKSIPKSKKALTIEKLKHKAEFLISTYRFKIKE